MPDLKIAIVGCGRMGRERARCVNATEGARVEAVFDVDGERAAELASQNDTRAVADLQELLALPLDAVFVCIAPGARGVIELACFERGLALFVEKPVGTSLSHCTAILQALATRPLINAVGYMNRYRRSVAVARDVLRGAEIIGLSAHWVSKRYGVPWWSDPSLSGGPHNEQATHLYDLSRFLAGEVNEVKSVFSGSTRAVSSMRFNSGALGTLYYSCDGPAKDIGLRVFTTTGSLLLADWNFRLVENSIDGRLADEGGEDIFLIETGAFLEAVRSGSQDLIKSTFADAARTQSLLDAARESSATLAPSPVEPPNLMEHAYEA